MPKDRGTSLSIITIWREANLLGLWPLHVRRAGSVTVATHLGCGGNEEYAGPLIARDPDEAHVASLALSAAKSLADVLRLYNLRPQSSIALLANSERAFSFRSSVFSPIITLRGEDDWEGWLGKKSKNFRHEVRKFRRRLESSGQLKSINSSAGADGPEIVRWLFQIKRRWLADRGISRSWILDPLGEQLFESMLAQQIHEFHAFALTLDGKIIAAGLCFLSQGLLEFHMIGFDPEFAYFSPGNLLVEDIAKWALLAGVDLDFRLTQLPFKMRWIDREERYDSFAIACSVRGIPTVGTLHLRHLNQTVRSRLGPKIKALLGRRRTP